MLPSGERKDCGERFADWTPVFFRNGGLSVVGALSEQELQGLPRVPEQARWGSCVPRPGKVICIGLNYRDHAIESGLSLPSEPTIFMKAANTVVGPFDPVLIPRGSQKTDWEVELGVVIGRDARYLSSPGTSRDYIAGFCICHDVSEREFQMDRGGQWTKGKSCDNFMPLGPWLLTEYEPTDILDLSMWLEVNGQRMQEGRTGDMAFDPFFLVHYLSQFMTLEAGDLISTGTPAGVGFGMNPPQYLKTGDVVELSITGLGRQMQTCQQA